MSGGSLRGLSMRIAQACAWLIAIAAAAALGARVQADWAAFPRELDTVGLAAVAAYGVAAFLLVIVAGRRLPPGQLLLLGAVILVVSRIAPAVAIRGPLVSDWRYLHEAAIAITHGANLLEPRPNDFGSNSAYAALLAAVYTVVGPRPGAGELLNAGMGIIGGAALAGAVHDAWGRRAAAIALLLYALWPAGSLMTVVLGTESTYVALLLVGVFLLGRAARDGSLLAAAGAGLALGLSQYVRPISMFLLVVFVAVLRYGTGRLPRRSAGVAAAACVVILAPVIATNLSLWGEVSVSTSQLDGWSLYVGANQQSNGTYTVAERARFDAFPGDTVRARSDIAMQHGIQRIVDDPVGFVGLAVRKFPIMWSSDDYGTFYALDWQHDPPLNRGTLNAFYLASQLFYALAALGAAVALARRPPGWLAAVAVGVLLVLVGLHTFVEVQARYHLPMEPLLFALAAWLVGNWGLDRPGERTLANV